MATLLENIQALIEGVINPVAGLIEMVVGIFIDIGKDEQRPKWVRLLSIMLCLAFLAGIVWLFWTYIAILIVALVALAIIGGLLSGG